MSFLIIGVIIDVYSRGKASLRLDSSSRHSSSSSSSSSSHQLSNKQMIIDDVSERHVEAVVPKIGGYCMVLKGEYTGQGASLLSVDKDSQMLTVQLQEDLEVIELDMDSISEVA